jgi:hypothetical protein
MAQHKHEDDEPVMYGYSSSRNISMRGSDEELGVTWGEWREMSDKQRADAIQETVNELIDVWVEADED